MATPKFYKKVCKRYIMDEITYCLTAKEIEKLFINVLNNKMYASRGIHTKKRININIEKLKIGLINFIEQELLNNPSFLTVNQYNKQLDKPFKLN